MVRSDLALSGVMFTLDTESGFRDVVFITSAYGWAKWLCRAPLIPTNSTYNNHHLEAGFPAVIPVPWVPSNSVGVNKDRFCRQSVRIEN